ncbi:YciI family protein [Luteolibacter sp. SL250]|uniref:YciI family protein n=1 Tax=Luteolibacter sp. SL250 TaxID=2995170 RepID=UPI00226EFF42|nr:YciI family protein [Luteolibacter sp. SL250]WAC17791.1 YciI family protein [Luteolibacter sp. SL250]
MKHDHQNAYLLLFRGTDWHRGLSIDEVRDVMSRWEAWYGGVVEAGNMIAASPLENEGKLVSGKNKEVADGPFAESKETVGGFFMVNAASMEEAVELAKACPALPYGLTVEVRPAADVCPSSRVASAAHGTT